MLFSFERKVRLILINGWVWSLQTHLSSIPPSYLVRERTRRNKNETEWKIWLQIICKRQLKGKTPRLRKQKQFKQTQNAKECWIWWLWGVLDTPHICFFRVMLQSLPDSSSSRFEIHLRMIFSSSARIHSSTLCSMSLC